MPLLDRGTAVSVTRKSDSRRRKPVALLAIFALLAAMLLSFGSARAATQRYVATTGSDTGACTSSASPCKTITYAIGQAANGDTINVAAGWYQEKVTVNKSVTLRGDPGDASAGPGMNAPVLDGGSAQGKGFGILANDVVVTGFVIQNFRDTAAGESFGVDLCNATNVTISDNRITGNNYGIGIDQGNLGTCSNSGTSSNVSILNNVVSDNHWPPGSGPGTTGNWYAGGIGITSWYSTGSNHVISGNVITNHDRNGILTGRVTGVLIANNTITNSGWSGIETDNSVNAILQNNVISGGYPNATTLVANWPIGVYVAASSVTITGLQIKGNTISGTPSGNGGPGLARGIVLQAGTNNTIDGASITGNVISGTGVTPIGIQVGPGTVNNTAVHSNSISGNVAGLKNLASAVTDATSNWWGQPSGPTLSANPGGTGDAITGNVSFSPWCASSACTSFYGLATRLVFTTQPGSAVVGAVFGTQPVVRAEDASGNLGYNFNGAVTIAVGTNPAGGTLSGTTTVNAINGVTTFSGLSIDRAGVGYTLVASATVPTASPTAQTVTSAPFDIAVRLVFTTQPGGAVAGGPFATQPVVRAEDASGNVSSSFNGTVTVALGTNPAGGTLSGTTTVNAVNGVATFSGLSIDRVGTGYTLVASGTPSTGSPPAQSATSAPFDVAALPSPMPPTSNWDSQGGLLGDSPSAVGFNGEACVLAKGSDDALYIECSRPTTSGAVSLATATWQRIGGKLTSAPTAVSSNGVLYVFARGTDNQLYVTSSTDARNFTAWRPLGGVLTSAPAVVAFNGRIYVFTRGTDNALWSTSSTDGVAFTAWGSLGGILTDAPAAASVNGTLYVVAKGSDNALYLKRSSDGMNYGGWQNFGGVLTAAPAVVGYRGQLYLFARGTDNALYEQHTANGVDYTGWRRLGGVLTAAPAATTVTSAGGQETLYVFARGTDNTLWELHTLP